MAAMLSPWRWLADALALRPDVSRGCRATLAFIVPLLLALSGKLSVELSLTAIAAQNLAMVDLRGDYRVRCALLLCMATVLVCAVALGAATADDLYAAAGATALLAIAGGLWRHLSVEFGPPLAIASLFVFLFALGAPHGPGTLRAHVVAALAGAGWGVLIQIAQWPFRPQHGLRRAAADSWVAVSELCSAISTDTAAATPWPETIREREAALRGTLDAAYATLGAARAGELRARLERLNAAAARLGTLITSLHSALEASLPAARRPALAPTLEPALTSLANLARSAAITAVSRHPGQFATFEVRLRRVHALLRVVVARFDPASADASPHVAEIVRQLAAHLDAAHDALRATIDHVEQRSAVSLELLDLRALALRPLASVLNLNAQLDPALVRYSLRLAVLTVGGVVAFKLLHLPHGYWLPFTVVVVLQPDYGSTRERAAQRMLGTLGGSLAASIFLWLHLPLAAVLVVAAGTMFAFGYWLKRNYALAMFFITVFVVLLIGLSETLTFALTIERLASTAAGGLLAFAAALLFWPVWERDRLPPILAQAFRANRDYLDALVARLAAGGVFDADAIRAKQRAEGANSAAFSSLRRLSGDPKNRREGLEHAATLANGNQRLTRALNVLSLHLAAGAPLERTELRRFAALAGDALDTLAEAVTRDFAIPPRAEELLRALESDVAPPAPLAGRDRWIFEQLARAATELSALLLALQDAAPARTANA